MPLDSGASLQTIELPTLLDSLDEEVQAQLREQFDTARGQGSDDAAALGAAQGLYGQMLLAYGLDEAARPALQNARMLLPREARWPYYLGHVARKAGRVEEALGHYAEALELEPGSVPALVRIAQIERDLGKDEQARQRLREALRLDPGVGMAHFELGQLSMAAGDASLAIRHLEEARRLQPEASVIVFPLARAYRENGDIERSDALLQVFDSQDVASGSSETSYTFALDEPYIVDLDALKEGASFQLAHGQRLLNAGMVSDALPVLEEAARLQPESATAWSALGIARGHAGDATGSEQAFARVLELDPEQLEANFNLALSQLARGEGGEAAARLEQVVERDPRHFRGLRLLATIRRTQDRCDQAGPLYTRALGVQPADHPSRIGLAMCAWLEGDAGAALDSIETGQKAFPEDLALRDSLARLLATHPDPERRDPLRALSIAEALAAEFEAPETRETLGMALAANGRLSEGADALNRALELLASNPEADAEYRDHLRRSMAEYGAGRASEMPWPEFILRR